MLLSLLAATSILVEEQPLVQQQCVDRPYIGLAPKSPTDVKQALCHIPLLKKQHHICKTQMFGRRSKHF